MAQVEGERDFHPLEIVSTNIAEAQKIGAETNWVIGEDLDLLVLLFTLSPEYTAF